MVARLIYSLILALCIGYLTAKNQIADVVETEALRVGPWRTLATLDGEVTARGFVVSYYLKAATSLEQKLPSVVEEEILFLAITDTSGAPLRIECSATFQPGPFDEDDWLLTIFRERGVPLVSYGPGDIGLSGALTLSPNGDLKGSYTLALRIMRPSFSLLEALPSGSAALLPRLDQGACP